MFQDDSKSETSVPMYWRCTTLKLYVVRAIVFSATSLESIKLSTLTFRSSSSGIDLKNEKLISVRQRCMLFSIK